MAFLKRRRFISVVGRKSAVPDGLWMKCPGCGDPVLRGEVAENQWVCTHCNYHHRIPATTRIEYLVDPGTFQESHAGIVSADPLEFVVDEAGYAYAERIEQAKEKTGLNEAMITGFARIESMPVVVAVMDFAFRGGSMGSAVGEKFCRAVDDAIQGGLPFVLMAASGGARMEEGVLSLMQMAKTADAVRRLNEAVLPYFVVLTDPTTGGVYASLAGLGDITLAEPGAHIGFAGPRVIEGALKVELPEGFQSAEYQFENGFVDRIVRRTELRPLLAKLIRYLSNAPETAEEPEEAATEPADSPPSGGE